MMMAMVRVMAMVTVMVMVTERWIALPLPR